MESKLETVGKSENSKTGEESKDQDEEQWCKSSIKRLARRHREEHAILAEVGEVDQRFLCFDDATSKDLLWHEVRQSRDQQLKYLRDLGVYEQVDEREAIAQYQVTPVDTQWIDTNKTSEGEPMQIRSRWWQEDSKVKIDQICIQGLLRWKR